MAEVKIEQLRPNSHKYKEEQKQAKKVEPVVGDGDVIVKKKTTGKKLKEAFFGGDFHTASEYVAYDVLVPAIKRGLSDMGANFLDMLLFGSATSDRRRTRNGGNERVSYTSYYKSDVRDNRRNDSVDNHSGNDYRDIVITSRGKADEVLETLRDVIDEYGQASVADFYDALGMTNVIGDFTDNNYGWVDLRNVKVRMVKDGYVIDLPKAVSLKS